MRKQRSLTELAEDAYGTPPAARSGMMMVADDNREPADGEELLTDEGDDTTVDGPLYPEGTVRRLTVAELRQLIQELIVG